VDLNTVHNPATGTVAPAAWGDQIRENQEFLIDPPGCSVFHSTTQSIATATVVVLNANSENFDNDAMHSTVTNNSRITIQTAGRYLITAAVQWDTNANNDRQVLLRKNGVVQSIAANTQVRAGVGNTGFTVVATTIAAAGDYIEAFCRQTSGGNLNVELLEFVALFLTRN
jgi:hypothetical protein